MSRPPLPPFDHETALAKVQAAEDAWNSRDPAKVAQAYTPDSTWRNRDEFFEGREAIEEFLTSKWASELHYRLMKELWAYNTQKPDSGIARTATSTGNSMRTATWRAAT